MKGTSVLLLFIVILSILGCSATRVEGQQEPKLYVYPPSVSATPGETFIVGVKVDNVKNLYTYQFKLSWEPSLLNVTSVTEGPFLNAEGSHATYFDYKTWNEPDPLGVSGYVYVACTLFGEPATSAASGSGTLATLEFRVEKEGTTPLHLYETSLISSLMVEITHDIDDGYFEYLPPSAPNIYVKPSSVIDASLRTGSVFSVNISVIQAVGVYAWSLNMSWNPTLLNVTDVEEGSFLNQGAYNTTFKKQILQEEGRFYANCSLFEEPPEVSANGNGTLIRVNFLVEAVGNSVLDLYDTKLLGYGGGELPHTTRDGYFDNSRLLRDVSIVSVMASPTTVKAGDSVSITVVARNDGEVTENFDVIVYWGDINIGTVGTSDLSPGAEKTLIFSWKTEGMAEGNHPIKAVASSVIWEANTDNNTQINGNVVITPPEQTFSVPPILIAAVIIVILIVVAIIGVILVRKRR